MDRGAGVVSGSRNNNDKPRRQVRVLRGHTLVEGDDSWAQYHEWVRRGRGINDCETRDAIGRQGNSGGYRWDYWCCNNPDCEALALVSVVAVEEMVQSWLPDDFPLSTDDAP
jgi:hypothetical protein